MEDIFALAQHNQQCARKVLQSTQIMELWQSIGAHLIAIFHFFYLFYLAFGLRNLSIEF